MANIKQIKLNNTTYDIVANSMATSGTTDQFWRGDNTWATLNIPVIKSGTTTPTTATLAIGEIYLKYS